MRILHLPSTYAPVLGGAEVLCQRVSETLVQQGHHVRVVTSDVGNMNGYYDYGVPRIKKKQELINDVEVKRLPYGGGWFDIAGSLLSHLPMKKGKGFVSGQLSGLIQRRFTTALEHEIHSFQPDVVMVMSAFINNVQCALSVHKNSPFPLVMVPLVHQDWTGWIVENLRVGLRQADAVIALTAVDAGELQNLYNVPESDIFISALGIDLPPLPLKQERSHQVLFLGRKTPEKGILDLIAAMRLVWQKHPQVDLILAGARSSATETIDSAINDLPANLSCHVKSLDDVTEEEKARLLATSCCLVLPSQSESFGIVLLEAMAHCTPVITPDLPVFRTIVTPHQDGFLVEPGDSESMAKSILYFIEHPDQSAKMGQIGRGKIEKLYTWERTTASFLRAYEHAMQKRR